MIRRLLSLLVFVGLALPAWATTWYVRPDGGTRYTTSSVIGGTETGNPSGQCDGLSDLPAAGASAHHCAFLYFDSLYSTGSYVQCLGGSSPQFCWVAGAADTVILRGSLGTGATYRVGWPNASGALDSATGLYHGLPGDNGDSGAPPPPAGLHLYGENYASCSAETARTQLHGSYGTYAVLDLRGTQNLDIRCLDITDFSQCFAGHNCQTTPPIDDFTKIGVVMSNQTTGLHMDQIKIHGTAGDGLRGPTGTGGVWTNIAIRGNPDAGWSADDGTTGNGVTLLQNFDISWNGCAEEYPIAHALPYVSCLGQNGGGYGDGFGTATIAILTNGVAGTAYSDQLPGIGVAPYTFALSVGTLPAGLSLSSSGLISGTPTTNGLHSTFTVAVTDSTSAVQSLSFQIGVGSFPQGWQVTFDQGLASYNTQDGLDALHLRGNGSSMTITRVLAYGNMGQQIKVGGQAGTADNNVIVTNCNALQAAIPGTPSGYNSQLLTPDFCRAGDTGIVMDVGAGVTTRMRNNTIYSASETTIEVECDTTDGPCDGTAKVDFRNNLFVGYLNSAANGYGADAFDPTNDYASPVYIGESLTDYGLNPFTASGSLFSHNLWFHWKSTWTCPNTADGETTALCVDPQLSDETWHLYGYGNMQPLAGSPALAAAVPIAGLTVDYAGNARSGTTPSIGAFEGSVAAALLHVVRVIHGIMLR